MTDIADLAAAPLLGPGAFAASGIPPLAAAALVSLAGFLALWPVSLARRDSSLADLWWGPGFAAAAWAAFAFGPGAGPAGAAALGLVTAWSLRLGWALARRRLREGVEDPRYASMRAEHGAAWPLRSLWQVFVLQGALQFVLVAPVAALAAAGGGAVDGGIIALGALIALIGLGLETTADLQLDRWKARGAHGIMRTGLRSLVRHPNYTGEILFWTGMAAICAAGGSWWGMATPLLLALLLSRVSGRPPIEERLAGRPGWEEWSRRTPPFVPRARDLRAALRGRASGGRAHQ